MCGCADNVCSLRYHNIDLAVPKVTALFKLIFLRRDVFCLFNYSFFIGVIFLKVSVLLLAAGQLYHKDFPLV